MDLVTNFPKLKISEAGGRGRSRLNPPCPGRAKVYTIEDHLDEFKQEEEEGSNNVVQRSPPLSPTSSSTAGQGQEDVKEVPQQFSSSKFYVPSAVKFSRTRSQSSSSSSGGGGGETGTRPEIIFTQFEDREKERGRAGSLDEQNYHHNNQQQQSYQHNQDRRNTIAGNGHPHIVPYNPPDNYQPQSWSRIFQCIGQVFHKGHHHQGQNNNYDKEEADNELDHKKIEGKDNTSHCDINSLKPNSSPLHRTMTDSDLYLQELADTSSILEREDTKNLSKHFPARAVGCSWEKVFSTQQDGFSLHNLYRKMEDLDSPILLVVEDIEERVFGALLSCPLKVSDNFYGNSDTFLFRCRPEFEVYRWSGNNFYFMQGQDNFFSVGSDDGKFGLWLDDNLFMGRTDNCSTFSSLPLVPEKDFKIKTVEAWGVGMF